MKIMEIEKVSIQCVVVWHVLVHLFIYYCIVHIYLFGFSKLCVYNRAFIDVCLSFVCTCACMNV